MDGFIWTLAVTAISMSMVSQCASKARTAATTPAKSYNNAQYHEQPGIQRKSTSASTIGLRTNPITTTTIASYPANPYVFSAEDYDVLQHNLQGASSLVSYEPQRIDIDTGRSSLASTVRSKFYRAPSMRRSPKSRRDDVSARVNQTTSLAYQSPTNQRRRRVITTKTTEIPDRHYNPMTRRKDIVDQEPAGMMIVLNDRMPRPFAFSSTTTVPMTTSLATRNYRQSMRQRHDYRTASSPPVPVATDTTVSTRRKSAIKASPRHYENLEPLTTSSPPIIYTIPKRRRQPNSSTTTATQVYSTTTLPRQTTSIPLEQTEQPASVQQTVVETQVSNLENSYHNEQPTENPSPKIADRREYNFSHVERYEEPLEPTKDINEHPDELEQAGDQTISVAEVQDLASEGDYQHKSHEKPKYHHEEGEEGVSAEHHKGDHQEEGDKGHKGYKSYHEHEDADKGHHVKEGHDHHYDEDEGAAKKHHDEAGYHEEHEHGEEGEKEKSFHEKGKHNKGHSTKGKHVVHKKDAFEKKIEFYDESHEGGDDEKKGEYHHEHHREKGDHYKKGHHHKGHDEAHHGHKGHHEKGHHHHSKKGHHKEEGDDHHHHHEQKHGKKGGHEDAKHWHQKKGKRR